MKLEPLSLATTRSALLLSCLLFSACSTTHLSRYTQEKDPFESYNRMAYSFNDALDKAILKPVAQGYVKYMPQLGKMATQNFFSNLDDVTVTCNDLLQLKFKQAASDGSRVLFNTTFGIFGLIEVTTRLPKHNEDFGQTLGYWGAPSGPYVVIPVLGPSSVRDGAGRYADSFVSVIGTTQHIPTRNSAYVVEGIVARASLLDNEKILENATIDRYSSLRDAYLMRRRSLVYDGDPPRQKYEDFDDE
ncbi:MAG: VacJ family lipoprotein [Gammaproteobacteria bacterium]|nr:VacJ family lipoprotein [Gammaproteobacteria bacterium]MBU1623729.1 VacJ family lipoprotein [Gammaproteobacteria bacterium]